MQSKQSTPSRIIFQLSGPSLAEVIRWQQARDLDVIRHQIESKGMAMTIWQSSARFHGFQDVSELPQPGEVVPYYGDVGDAYSFHFRPEAGGCCYLRVTNDARGKEYWHPEPFLPLELHLPDPVQIDFGLPGPRWHGFEWPWWHNRPNTPLEELRFAIDHEYCPLLVEGGGCPAAGKLRVSL